MGTLCNFDFYIELILLVPVILVLLQDHKRDCHKKWDPMKILLSYLPIIQYCKFLIKLMEKRAEVIFLRTCTWFDNMFLYGCVEVELKISKNLAFFAYLVLPMRPRAG